jgi:hypothetical protein
MATQKLSQTGILPQDKSNLKKLVLYAERREKPR